MANAKKRSLLIKKCCNRFSNKIENLYSQVDYYNNKHKDRVMEVKSIPPLDNTMYPKLILVTKKK
jgi:transcription elongation factor Elf1